MAGVIGRSKFGYDIWGDTVNTASRMESYAAPGTIQVTERTYRRLERLFVLERRAGVAVKGKGEMTTYVLLAERRQRSVPELLTRCGRREAATIRAALRYGDFP